MIQIFLRFVRGVLDRTYHRKHTRPLVRYGNPNLAFIRKRCSRLLRTLSALASTARKHCSQALLEVTTSVNY